MPNFKKIRKLCYRLLLAGMLLFFFSIISFFIFYNRYLYHLPENIANEIPSHTAISHTDFLKAIEQGRKFALKHVHDWNLPSMSVAVGKDGKVLWAESFGYADADQKIPARADMAYRIHSVSKPLTAMAIAKLWEQGVLDLEKPIREYLPDFPEKKYAINMRQLLSHQSGIRHYNSDEEIFNKKYYPNMAQSLTIFENDSLLFEPGRSFSYSSHGYNLAGAVVEKIINKPFIMFMQEELFAPLGMTHTGVERDSFPGTGILKYYEMDSNGRRYEAPFIDLSMKYPSGGMVATPEDLVRFGLAMLDNEFVSESTFRQFTEPQHTATGIKTNYGLGWEISSPVGGWKKWLAAISGFFGWNIPHTVGLSPMLFHKGGSTGGMSILVIYPEQGVVFAFVANINGELPPVYKMPMMAAEGFFD